MLSDHLVNFSTRWCQVNLAQHRCLCFDIDVKHEDTLPISLESEMHPIVIHHQCPSAEAFRAEVSLTEHETRRDHWNNVISQQMIPKEGRVSHISFEQDKKQSARRYYDLSSTVVDFLPEYTNIITISSQPPSWFFSPKALSLPLKECLREINYCDNSFIQEVFTSATLTSGLKLQSHEISKYKNHSRWSFFHIFLSPEQCFRLKSIHQEREEWKVRFYDELIIRTFERSSIFITIPPGISLSQIIDNNSCCELKEAFTYSDPTQHSFPSTASATGTKEQYRNTLPHNHSVNGAGMGNTHNTYNITINTTSSTPSREHKQTYCPPNRTTRPYRRDKQSVEEDVDMTPNKNSEPPPKSTVNNQLPPHDYDVTKMTQPECGMTVPDSPSDSVIAATPAQMIVDKDTGKSATPQLEIAAKPVAHRNTDANEQAENITATNQLDRNSTAPPSPSNHKHPEHSEDVTGGYSRLASESHMSHTHNHDRNLKPENPPLTKVTHTALPPGATIQSPSNPTEPPVARANDNQGPAERTLPPDRPDTPTASVPHTSRQEQTPTPKKNIPTSQPHLQASTIRECLQRNTAFRPLDRDEELNIDDDDTIFISATDKKDTPTIDDILLQADQCGTLVNVCKEIILGWPQSFAHADDNYLAKLAACYSIHFQSYMCYAVAALRTLAHAPWKDDMFFGHIRELVLCAIGNGWTWSDQSASVQGRRISTAEVCAALASYTNLKAFPPGQISDLDTAIIAVCDDLFPEHVSLFFATFNLECPVCNAKGSVSVSVFDSLLIHSPTDNRIDLPQMLTHRTPRLALDREDIDFAHASDCTNVEHITYHQTPDCLMFTLKITCPQECLPPILDVLRFLDQTFDVQSLASNADPLSFTVTGILTVQGHSSHHFVIIERFHQQKVLLYDNLMGYKWLPLDELRPNSKAWGFIFRKQDHKHYSFQPQQYKAIAPDVRNAPKPSPSCKSAQRKSKPSLGVNAKKYNCPALPSKPSKNDAVTSNPPTTSTESAAQQGQTAPNSEYQQTSTPEKHCNGEVHGGVLIVGQSQAAPDDLNIISDALPAHTPQHSHPGVLRVGDAPTAEPHNIAKAVCQTPLDMIQEQTNDPLEGALGGSGPPVTVRAEQDESSLPPHGHDDDPSPPGEEVTVQNGEDLPTAIAMNDPKQRAGETPCTNGNIPPPVPGVVPLLDVHPGSSNCETETPRLLTDPFQNHAQATREPKNDVSPPEETSVF